jgi:hypothetical protein
LPFFKDAQSSFANLVARFKERRGEEEIGEVIAYPHFLFARADEVTG